MEELSREMVINPVEAVRLYRYNPWAENEQERLSALFMAQFYQIGHKYQAKHNPAAPIIMMRLPSVGHEAMEIDCFCGFYAVKDESYLRDMFSEVAPITISGAYYAMGSVLLSGTIVEHEFGYRASEMTVLPIEQVVHISKATSWPSANTELEKHFSSCVVSMNEWREAMRGDTGEVMPRLLGPND